MNVPLLLEIKARILAEPDAFRMDVWTCGTAHCIGGWALSLNDVPMILGEFGWVTVPTNDQNASTEIARLLDVSRDSDGEDGESGEELPSPFGRLCFLEEWPRQFFERYEDAVSRQGKAAVAAERIDHFIATDGAE